MALKIRSNKHWRNFLYGYELTDKEKSEFDWIDQEEIDTHNFFKYRGCVYSLDQFMRFNGGGLDEWDGYAGDSYFSGVVIKLSDDGEQYQVGTYIS